MPLEFPDWTWTQSESTVCIQLPLRGAAGTADIVSTERYLKVHQPPYLFEAFLFQPVDEAAGTARLTDTRVVISLPKKTPGLWTRLRADAGPEERRRLREEALRSHQEALSSGARLRAESKAEDSRYALRAMMELEEEERERIREMKESEREKMEAELSGLEAGGGGRSRKRRRPSSEAERPADAAPAGGSSREVPAPRAPGHIRVAFTPRAFPTALRESRVAEEEEQWLRKQAAARHVTADAAELQELQESQRNPDWLKDKADGCFRRGDHLGALSAYSLAIRLHPRVPALYSNRAACHLKLKNLHKAVEDASQQALDLLTPPVEANAAARARAHVRRGSALCQLQLYAEGLQDYQAALKISPADGALQADVRTIREVVQGRVDAGKPTR
uniref:CS domain-containing protein n=1 Tax=Tetraodon nigroviridis TaxID=99883 RepID=H3CNZ8_TETNG